MNRSRTFSSIALVMTLAACSESTSEPMAAQRDLVLTDCVTHVCKSTLAVFPSTINLNAGPQLVVLAFGNLSLPNGSRVMATAPTGPSDTIPGPVPPAPGQWLRSPDAQAQMHSILVSMFEAGMVAPSDTIPSPAPPSPMLMGASTAVSLKSGVTMVVTSSTELLKRGIIGPERSSFLVTVLKGNTTLLSDVASFEIIGPD